MCLKYTHLPHDISFSEICSCQTPSNVCTYEGSKTLTDCSLHTWHQPRPCKEFKAK